MAMNGPEGREEKEGEVLNRKRLKEECRREDSNLGHATAARKTQSVWVNGHSSW
jgi:hypothetical protein